jgi:N-acetylmuramoyl-L-alanine amidase
MFRSKKTALLFCGAITLLLSSVLPLHAASDWKVIKVGNREYLSVENIAQFYGFPADVVPIGKTVRLDNGRNSMAFRLDSREAIINGVRNWLSFPVIEHEGKFLVSRVDLAKSLEPQLRPHMIQNLGRLKTVVLDPGHGGHDKGACSRFGCEKEYALDVARQLKPLLEAKGLKVMLTRDSDVFIPLEYRARVANSARDSIFVSLHFNATDMNPAATGFEIFSLTPRGSPSTEDNALALRFLNMQAGSPVDAPSLALSAAIYHSVIGHLPEFDRGIKRSRFAVLRLTKVPAVLVEGGFMTQRGEGRLIADSTWRAKLAQSISTGIENYRDLVEQKRRPMLVADYRMQQLGDQLIARDAGEPAPDVFADPSVITPASNAQLTVPLTNSHDVAMEGGETELHEETPELIGPPFEPNHDSTAAVEESKPVEIPAAPEPEVETVASNPPAVSALDVGRPPAALVPPQEQAPSAKSPAPKKHWFLGPFPKFHP